MGYSNNKWRKILTILMIINLCFILFAKFSKCLASSGYSGDFDGVTYNVPEDDYNIPSNYTYRLVYLRYGNQISESDGVRCWFWYSDSPFVATSSNDYFILKNSSSNNLANVYNCTNNIWNSKPWFSNKNTNFDFYSSKYKYTILYCSNDIILNDEVVIPATPDFSAPTFDNSTSEIQSLDFDYLFINPRDYGIDNKLYFKLLEVTNVVENPNDASKNIYYYNDLTFSFDKNSKYLKEFFDTGTYYYSLPYSALKLKKDKSYYFVLTNNSSSISQSEGELVTNDTIYNIILCDTQNLITTNDEILNSIINNNTSDNTDNNINNNLPRPRL